MKKTKKINTICTRAAALGCAEDIQIEIKKIMISSMNIWECSHSVA